MAISTNFNYGYAFVFLTIIINLIATAQTEAGCDTIRNIFQRKGFSLKDVPNAPKPPGEHMGTCGTGFSCCTAAMEYKLAENAGEEFEGNLYEASYLVRDSFVSKSEKFDNYFIELLDKSDRDFSAMFQHTYGNLYNDNKAVFDVLYSDLRDFYHGRIDDLENALDDFFANVLQKMYALLNPGEYSDDFMVCIAEHLDDLKPFGSIPGTLTTQMRRSLNAARTYVQGLDVARDIVTKATKESPVSECKTALMKMEYCQSCKGMSKETPAPCDDLCTNIMKACLAQQAEIAEEWTKFTDSMLRLGERMSSSFNIETVIDSINVKVSEGIMNYQENSGHVSQKVAEECGQHMRKRRSSGSKKKKKSKKKEDWSRYRPQGNKQQSVALGATLSSYIHESDEMLNNARDFWTDLPYLMCNDDGYAAEKSNQNCWTGVEIGSYENDVIKSGLAYQVDNPEVDMLNTKKRQSIIDYKSLLKDITSQLNHAYSGKDTTFISIEDDEDYDGSGSGSGSGSGDIPTDLENDLTITTIDKDPKYRPTKFPDSGAPTNVTWTFSVLFFSVLFSRLFRSH